MKAIIIVFGLVIASIQATYAQQQTPIFPIIYLAWQH